MSDQKIACYLLKRYASDLRHVQAYLFTKGTEEYKETITGYRFDSQLIPNILQTLEALMQGKSYFSPEVKSGGISGLNTLPSDPIQGLIKLCIISRYPQLEGKSCWGFFLQTLKDKYASLEPQVNRLEEFHDSLQSWLDQEKSISPSKESIFNEFQELSRRTRTNSIANTM